MNDQLGQKPKDRIIKNKIEPVQLDIDHEAFNLSGEGVALDSFKIYWFNGAFGKFHYGQVNWIIFKAGYIFIHMPYSALILRGQHLAKLAHELCNDRVVSIRQGNVHAENSGKRKTNKPFVEEVVLISSSKLEDMVGCNPNGQGFNGSKITNEEQP